MPAIGLGASPVYLRGNGGPLLWLLDFSLVTLGGGSIADSNVAFSRASGGGSVQTSASTLVTAGLGNDVPRFGSNGGARGLVIEGARTNRMANSRNFGAPTWTTSAGTITPGQASPDGGTGASLCVTTSANYVVAEAEIDALNSTTTTTAWYRAPAATASGGFNTFRSAAAARVCNNTAVSTTWQRLDITAADTGGFAAGLVDGRDFSGFGGLAAGARNIHLDAAQREVGQYPGEFVPTAGATATRAGDRMSLAASKLVSGGRVEFECDLWLKGALSEYATDGPYVYVLSTDASNYVRMDTATRKFEICVAGAAWLPATVASANRIDRLQLRFAAGGGSLQSRAYYAVNGGAYTSLGTTSPQGTWASGATDVLSAGTSGQLACWLASARAYSPGRMP